MSDWFKLIPKYVGMGRMNECLNMICLLVKVNNKKKFLSLLL